MSELQNVLVHLSTYLVPSPGYRNDNMINAPEPSDQNAAEKMELLNLGSRIYDAGQATLAEGKRQQFPEMSEERLAEIEDLLEGGFIKQRYCDFIIAIQAVVEAAKSRST